MSELYDREKNAIESLRQWVIDNPDCEDYQDAISEIADSNVPIYTGDILQCALDNLWLATEEPEIGPAFDGTPTPINLIAANIYEHLTEKLYEEWSKIEEEIEEIKGDALFCDLAVDVESLGWVNNDTDRAYYVLDLFGTDSYSRDFWGLFNNACKLAQAFGAESLVIEWKISESDVTRAAEVRKERQIAEADRLIEKQAARNTPAEK